MYQYQATGRFFAQLAGGLEAEGASELTELGATATEEGYRGVHFAADLPTLYRCNLASRLATRILAPLVTFDCHSDRYLYRTARDIAWSDFIGPDDSLAIVSNVSNSRIRHSHYAALKVKDAIVDQFRDQTGKRPNIDRRNPSLWVSLHIHNNRAVISVDTSGGSLHRRGYRVESVEAPMQETVAAAAVRWTGWHGERKLVDPMCGSGTLVAEAVMHATKTPAGYFRKYFGFERLPDFDATVWKEIRKTALDNISPLATGLVEASDIDAAAVAATKKNLANLPSGDAVRVTRADFRTLPTINDAVIICNPPYGLRIGGRDMATFYKEFGDFLKQKCTGCTAFVYFGKREWIKKIGLRASFKKPLVNGALDGRLVRYDLY